MALAVRCRCPIRALALMAVGLASCSSRHTEPRNDDDATKAPEGPPKVEDSVTDRAAPTSTAVAALQWPSQCLVENVAVHPTKPWVAVACTNAEAEQGAVIVIDAMSGALRSVATHEGYVGWSGPDLLRWHPDGERLTSNVHTNGIALFSDTRAHGSLFPDDTRDHGVRYVWVDDHRVYVDTGSLATFVDGEDQFRFTPIDGAPSLAPIQWNDQIDAVVGVADGEALVAYDPLGARVVYRQAFDAERRPHVHIAPNGRWALRVEYAIPPAPDEMWLHDGDTGELVEKLPLASPRYERFTFSPQGKLAVSTYRHHPGADPTERRVTVFDGGKRQVAIELGATGLRATGPEEAGPIAWAPSGLGLALLFADQTVRVHDAMSGHKLASFEAPAPPVPSQIPDYGNRDDIGGIVWTPNERLVRVGQHFVSIWTLDGQRVSEFIVPE